MIYEFIIEYWADILITLPLVILSVIPIIPPTWAGFHKTYFNSFYNQEMKQKNMNFYELIVHLFSHVIVTGPALSLGFRGTVTLILFTILGADLHLNHQITNNAVILSIVGILALYLEKLIDTASELTLWKIFTWKSKNNQNPVITPIPITPSEDITSVSDEIIH